MNSNRALGASPDPLVSYTWDVGGLGAASCPPRPLLYISTDSCEAHESLVWPNNPVNDAEKGAFPQHQGFVDVPACSCPPRSVWVSAGLRVSCRAGSRGCRARDPADGLTRGTTVM